MSYEIKIKGENDPVEAEDPMGRTILRSWESYTDGKEENQRIEVNGWFGRLSDIRSIRKRATVQDTSGGVLHDYLTEHTKLRNQTPEQKAGNVGLLKILHWACTDSNLEDADPNFKVDVYKRLLGFFRANPNRITFDLGLFKDLYDTRKIVDSYHIRGLNVVGEQIHSDIVNQKFICG